MRLARTAILAHVLDHSVQGTIRRWAMIAPSVSCNCLARRAGDADAVGARIRDQRARGFGSATGRTAARRRARGVFGPVASLAIESSARASRSLAASTARPPRGAHIALGKRDEADGEHAAPALAARAPGRHRVGPPRREAGPHPFAMARPVPDGPARDTGALRDLRIGHQGGFDQVAHFLHRGGDVRSARAAGAVADGGLIGVGWPGSSADGGADGGENQSRNID